MRHDILQIVRDCSTGTYRDWEGFVSQSDVEKWQKLIIEHLDSYKVEGNMRAVIGDVTMSLLMDEEPEELNDTIIAWVFQTVYALLSTRYWIGSGLTW